MRPDTIRLLLVPAAVMAIGLALPSTVLAAEGTTTSAAEAPATTTSTATEAPAPPVETTTAPEAEAAAPQAVQPQVSSQHPQGSSPNKAPAGSAGQSEATPTGGTSTEAGAPASGKRAVSPSALTPALPLQLQYSLGGVPAFFIESFEVPPFLLPIFQAAGTAYGIPWQVLAAINEVETDYGRDLSVSSAGAEGWMQFLPAEWAQYGVDANGDGFKDPYNPADAIFTAARYLRAAGGDQNIRAAVYSYNHSPAYVDSVMLRAQLLGGTPSELLGAVTGLTEARFPVHAASHFSDGFPTVEKPGSSTLTTLPGTTIYSTADAPVIAVQDGEVVQMGSSPTLGNFVSLRDAFGNTYTYAQLGDVSSLYPVLQPRAGSAAAATVDGAAAQEPAPSGPASAGAQPRSPLSEAGTTSGLALGASAGLEGAAEGSAKPAPPTAPAAAPAADPHVFNEGPDTVYLRPLAPGAQVIAGTVLGHVGASSGSDAQAPQAPHILFQIRPAGVGAPLIDPKPILDGWVALENSSVFRAKGSNPYLATSPSVGQVLLESKQQLQPQVIANSSITLSACARQDIGGGRVDKRVLAMLEYLSVSGLKPTVAGMPCVSAGAGDGAEVASAKITAIGAVPVAGHQGPGTLADTLVRRLLMLQGATRPLRIVSGMSYPGSPAALKSASGADAIRVLYTSAGGTLARVATAGTAVLSPHDWIKLIARLGEIPDPIVGRGPSSASIPDRSASAATEGTTGGHN